MQLVAYGAQDIYLTGNPQITFFKVVYRRHTNFSMESIEQTINGSVAFSGSVTSTISRNGDLVSGLHVQMNIADILAGGTVGVQGANIGHSLLKVIECEIGGQLIDKHYGHWLTVLNELTEVNPTGIKACVNTAGDGDEPSGGATLYQLMSYNHWGLDHASTALDGGSDVTLAIVPLQFWFCRNPGLALPLIALQYHEVKIKITLCGNSDFVQTSNVSGESFSNFKLFANYIYLDTDERRRFAQVSHEYLIEQLQLQEESSATATSANLTFNHPVKELIWTGRPQVGSLTDANGMAGGPASPATLADGNYQLKLNGHDRFAQRNTKYFTREQVHSHHSGFGGVTQRDSIAVYSFALKPEEHQPSGTCNFSRIDNAQLTYPAQAVQNGAGTMTQALTAVTATFGTSAAAIAEGSGGINIYAVNYNVLRIMSGMGGLAYSN